MAITVFSKVDDIALIPTTTNMPKYSYNINIHPTTRVYRIMYRSTTSIVTPASQPSLGVYTFHRSPMSKGKIAVTDTLNDLTPTVMANCSMVVFNSATATTYYEVCNGLLVYRHHITKLSRTNYSSILVRACLTNIINASYLKGYNTSLVFGTLVEETVTPSPQIPTEVTLGSMVPPEVTLNNLMIRRVRSDGVQQLDQELIFPYDDVDKQRLDIILKLRSDVFKLVGNTGWRVEANMCRQLKRSLGVVWVQYQHQLLSHRGDLYPYAIYGENGEYTFCVYDTNTTYYTPIFSFAANHIPTFQEAFPNFPTDEVLTIVVSQRHTHGSQKRVLDRLGDDNGFLSYRGRRLLMKVPAPW